MLPPAVALAPEPPAVLDDGPAPLEGPGLDAAILAEQVRIAHGHRPSYLPRTVPPNLVVGTILVAAMWSQVSHGLLVGWLLVEVAYQGVRTVLYHRYWQDPAAGDNAPRWAWIFTGLATINGAIWGSTGILFFTPGSPGHIDVLTVILCGMAAATIAVNAILPAALRGSSGAMLAFLILRFVAEGPGVQWTLAALLTLYLGFVMVTGRELHRNLIESIRRRFDNDELVLRLQQQTRALEQSQQAAEKANQAKSKFLAAASHDLRQPLHALTLFAASLTPDRSKDDVQRVAGHIAASASALNQLFNRLLDISKLDAGVVQANVVDFAVQDAFDHVRNDIEPLASRKRLRMRVRETAAVARTDPLLFEQMLRNLVANAIRYTDKGTVFVACRWRGDGWRVEVRDSGRGIPTDQQERVFEEFYQIGNHERDREKGLGLGLAIVARISALLGCPVSLSSAPDRGSTFAIDLPRGSPSAQQARVTEEEDMTSLAGLRVLVVDDDEASRVATHTLLGQWGCDSREAGSLLDAAGLMQGAQWTPEAVVSDYRLRDGVTGIEVLDWLRTHTGDDLPCLLITGDIEVDRLREVRNRGYPIMHKPLAPAKLRNFLAAARRDWQETEQI